MLFHPSSQDGILLLLIMFLTEDFILAVMPVLRRDLLAVTIHISHIILCTKEVCNAVTMLLLGFCRGNDAVHAAVKTLSREEAQTVADIDDGVLRLWLDELPLIGLWRSDLQAELLAEKERERTDVGMLVVPNTSCVVLALGVSKQHQSCT